MKKLLFLSLLLGGSVLNSSAQVTFTQVGSTTYDLQSNGSSARRIIVTPTGKKIITFTESQTKDVNAVDRGTGYNYFNGTSWNVTSFPFPTTFTRPESNRTGWPNPLLLNGNKELVVSHSVDAASSYGLKDIYRTAVGTGPWTTYDVTPNAETWARAVNAGDSILVIYSSSGGTINGVTGGLGMVRSYDGGITWTTEDTIPGINTNFYTAINGDDYSIDIQGKNIAIVMGEYDVTLLKSSDFGNTWTKTAIIAENNLDQTSLVTKDRSDRASTVAFDKNGKCHVMFGRSNNSYDATQATPGVYYSFLKNGIMYWDEYMVGQAPIVIPASLLTNESSKNKWPVPFYNLNRKGGNVKFQGYGNNLISSPSIAVADNGTVFASFSKLRVDNDSIAANVTNRDKSGFDLDDVYLIKSNDNGKTWVGPYNLTNNDTLEDYFASIAKTIDGSVHVLFQQDVNYGTAVGASGTNVTEGSSAFVNNSIVYAQVDTNVIATPVDITKPELTYNDDLLTDTITTYLNCALDLSKGTILSKYISLFDNSTGADSNMVRYSTNLNTAVAGYYKLNVWAEDASGNISAKQPYLDGNGNPANPLTYYSFDTITFVIHVITNDVTAPTVSLNGGDTAYVYQNTSYVEKGITYSDDNLCAAIPTPLYSSNVDSSKLGQYTATWTVKDAANNQTTATRTVIVGVEPTPNFGVLRKTSKSFQFIDSSLYSPSAWKWTFLPLPQTYTSKSPTLSFNKDTTINVCLEASNIFNAAPFNKAIKKFCKSVSIDVWGTGINGLLDESSVTVGPIPSKGELNVYLKGISADTKISLTNITGQTLMTNNYSINGDDVIKLDLQEFTNGVYFLKLETEGHSVLRKVVLER